jgi:hypothetical protein
MSSIYSRKVSNLKKLVALLMVLTVTLTFVCPMAAMAENSTDNAVLAGAQLKNPEPVQVSEFDVNKNIEPAKKLEAHTDISGIEKEPLPVEAAPPKIMSRTITEETTTAPAVTVVAGTVSDYLTATGTAKIYSLNLNPGVYLQAQLTQPANADLDYNLYLLDSDGNIVAYSEYATQVNGTSGTLPEALGYVAAGQTAATYYLYVYSANGGSISQAYTLDYSFSNAFDRYETDESASRALPFTFDARGTYLNTRNLSSPIDNDWYQFTVPDNRIYDKLQIKAVTVSTNDCSVQLYKNISTSGYKMQRIAASGDKFNVSTGTYYIRVSNLKTLGEYNNTDIQNYNLSITPIFRVDKITITDLNGTEGLNHVVNYSGYGAHFRTGTGTLTISGCATVKDSSTNTTYLVPGVQITGEYYNPYWESNNTPSFAVVTNTGVTDSSGRFNISIKLPPPMGRETYYIGMFTHYFDICEARAYSSENTSVKDVQTIFHLAYSLLT